MTNFDLHLAIMRNSKIVKTLSQNDVIITQAIFIGYEQQLHVLKCQRLYFMNMTITEIFIENMVINMAETLTQFKWE